MTISDIALLASIMVLIVVVVDWRRGVTGLGKMTLTKEGSPAQYWLAICLYLNFAFGMFWLAGKAYEPSIFDDCDIRSETCTITFESVP